MNHTITVAEGTYARSHHHCRRRYIRQIPPSLSPRVHPPDPTITVVEGPNAGPSTAKTPQNVVEGPNTGPSTALRFLQGIIESHGARICNSLSTAGGFPEAWEGHGRGHRAQIGSLSTPNGLPEVCTRLTRGHRIAKIYSPAHPKPKTPSFPYADRGEDLTRGDVPPAARKRVSASANFEHGEKTRCRQGQKKSGDFAILQNLRNLLTRPVSGAPPQRHRTTEKNNANHRIFRQIAYICTESIKSPHKEAPTEQARCHGGKTMRMFNQKQFCHAFDRKKGNG